MNRRKTSKRRSGPRHLLLWTTLLVVFMAELLFYTWCRVQCTRLGYQITAADQTRQNLITLQSQLKIELAHLKSPERIETIARNRLGLTMPKPEQTVVLP